MGSLNANALKSNNSNGHQNRWMRANFRAVAASWQLKSAKWYTESSIRNGHSMAFCSVQTHPMINPLHVQQIILTNGKLIEILSFSTRSLRMAHVMVKCGRIMGVFRWLPDLSHVILWLYWMCSMWWIVNVTESTIHMCFDTVRSFVGLLSNNSRFFRGRQKWNDWKCLESITVDGGRPTEKVHESEENNWSEWDGNASHYKEREKKEGE